MARGWDGNLSMDFGSSKGYVVLRPFVMISVTET